MLYVVVVLLAANFLERRGLLLVSLACCAATVFSYGAKHGVPSLTDALAPRFDELFVRLMVSLAVIVGMTLVALTRQKAAADLQRQARLLDLTHDGIFVRDMDDVITYWNRGAEELYGWQPDAAIGKHARELLRTNNAAAIEEARSRLLAAGHWEGEVIRTRRDGQQLVVAGRWSLQRDQRGRPLAVMETNTDVTDRKRAEEGLAEAQAELSHVMRATSLGELTASIAHEINQPLAAIVTNGEVSLRLLARDPPDLGEAREAIGDLIAAARRAADIIQRLRALFRKTEARKLPLDINGVIGEVVPLVQRVLINKQVTLHLELAPALPNVLADRVQLQQVIVNLVSNAADAMISVTDRPRDLFVRSELATEGRVAVAVQDSGVGIDPKDAGRLFDAFFTTKPEGMGIGLAVSRSIVQNHGGKLWATATSGPGATFRCRLPAAATRS